MARLEDNFYEYVNEAWLETAEIPEDKPSTGSFYEIDRALEQEMMDQSQIWLDDKESLQEHAHLYEYTKLLEMARDYDRRDELGISPVLPLFSWFDENICSWENLNEKYKELILKRFRVPMDFDVSIDMKDTSHYALYASAPSLIFPDRTYYERDDEQIDALWDVFRNMAIELARLFKFEDPESLVDEAIAFDKKIAPLTKSGEEQADYVSLYNPYTITSFASYSKKLDLDLIARNLVNTAPREIIVTEPEYLEHFDSKVMQTDNFNEYRSWAFLMMMLKSASSLSEDLRLLSDTFRRALSGIKESAHKDKASYYLAHAYFSMPVGLWYGKTQFGAEAKADVEKIAYAVIEVYKERLAQNTWLSKETIEQAIKKLDAIKPYIGYPEKLQPYYDEFKVKSYDEGGTLFSNMQDFSKIMIEYNFDKYSKPVETEFWSMSPDTVNAYYNPQLNHIVFPAGILQAPFYDIEQDPSANFGGIGAVMAHEISHAFDNNGSKFDEHGNMANWWSEEDYKNFEARAQKMIEAWDGLESFGGSVNGKLTVSENIADAGGISAALQAAKASEHFNAHAFFENWAKVWRSKSSEEYAQMLLTVDVHAPAPLRGNIQLQHLDEFAETYNLQEDDGMYLAPEKRVHIW
ncbi:MAG: M13-type metalloendopeptidase [Coriobacteriia bacterium]|nr:M13-type metalloendopeptidase [Coriobacteriia bacterium]